MSVREDYAVQIVETSIKELTAKDRIRLKDTSDARNLTDMCDDADEGAVIIEPTAYAVLDVHNDHVKDGQNKDYRKYLILDAYGQKYVTGSIAFWNSFIDIWNEIKGENPDEGIELKVFKRPSKNYNGDFVTCALL